MPSRLLLIGFWLLVTNVPAKELLLAPVSDLKELLPKVSAGDSIVLENGDWQDVQLQFESLPGTAKQPIHIRAETPGKVVLTGKVQFRLSCSHVIVSGLAFRDVSGVSDVFQLRSHSERHAHGDLFHDLFDVSPS